MNNSDKLAQAQSAYDNQSPPEATADCPQCGEEQWPEDEIAKESKGEFCSACTMICDSCGHFFPEGDDRGLDGEAICEPCYRKEELSYQETLASLPWYP